MDSVATLRQFNRTVTAHIGVLNSDFLGRKRSLAASRLLFEIGREGTEIRTLRSRLGLDSGYATRLLNTLEKEGLVHIVRSKEDGRVRRVILTALGRTEVATLDRLSDDAAESILRPLTQRQRKQLTDAMATVERLLRGSAITITTEDPTSPGAVAALSSYYRELAQRFPDGFDPNAWGSSTLDGLVPPDGYLVLAKLHERTVGCGAIKFHAEFAEIKRMWVAPSTRGLGVGRRLLARLEELSQVSGFSLVRLDTNKTLIEARRLYERARYREIPPYNDNPYAHHWYEKNLLDL